MVSRPQDSSVCQWTGYGPPVLTFLLPGTDIFKRTKNISLNTVSSWEKEKKSSAGAGGLLAPPSDACRLARLLLPAWSTSESWLRMTEVSGGKKGKTTLKPQIPLQGLAFSPQRHDFLISLSSDTSCNTELSTSASHLYGYQMNYTVFTGHKRVVLNWTGESRMQWGVSATFPHAFFCKSKVFRQKNSKGSFTFPRNNTFYIKETVFCAKAFSLLSSCLSMKWPFSRDFPGSSSLQGGRNVYMAMWLCKELKCSDV